MKNERRTEQGKKVEEEYRENSKERKQVEMAEEMNGRRITAEEGIEGKYKRRDVENGKGKNCNSR
jgi:hypothetical protein